MINKEVKDVKYFEGDELSLFFSNDIQIAISLKDEDYKSPEAVSFYPNKGSIVVF